MIDIQKDSLVLLTKLTKKFNVKRKTLYDWVSGRGKKKLDAVKIGGQFYTSWEAIERFAEPILTIAERGKKPEDNAKMKACRSNRGRPRKVKPAETVQPVPQQSDRDRCLLECD